MFDIYTLPIRMADGQESSDLPGFFVTAAPRQTARGREQDVLMTLVSSTWETQFPSSQMDELLKHTVTAYFSAAGTVTSGLRIALDAANQVLLGLNQRENGADSPALCVINLGIQRKDQLYLAHGGLSHSLIFSKGQMERCFDPYAAPPSLGVGRTVTPSFYQHAIQPGDLLVFCSNPPEAWTDERLADGRQLSLESLRRRLLYYTAGNLQLAILGFQTGTGEVRRLRRRNASQENEVGEVVQPEEPVSTVPAASAKPLPPVATRGESVGTTGIFLSGQRLSTEAPPSPKKEFNVPVPSTLPVPEEQPEAPPPTPKTDWRWKIAAKWQGWQEKQHQASQEIKKMLLRMLPGMVEQPPGFSSAVLVFVAIAIPVIIAAIATTTYFQRGRGEEHLYYLRQAQQFAIRAQNLDASNEFRKQTWNQVLEWLDVAEDYSISDESRALRQEAYHTIDQIDGIERVDMLPVIYGGFDSKVSISRMLMRDTDIYMLDSVEGRVLRLFLTGQGYTLDPQFNCGPGTSGSIYIEPLVGMAVLPVNSPEGATVMAVDGSGHVLYCMPGEYPLSNTLAEPSIGMGEITDFVLNRNTLYLLDSKLEALWMYYGTNMTFIEEPEPFFNEEEGIFPPEKMFEIKSLAIYEDELFLMRQDGRMITCTTYSTNHVDCDDPAYYGDLRVGTEQDILSFIGTRFMQIQVTRPPEPSLYMLDAKGNALYHFSLRLNLLRQLRPRSSGDEAIPDIPPTAFLVTPGKIVFVAYQNRLFYGELP